MGKLGENMTFLTFASPAYQSRSDLLMNSIRKHHPRAIIIQEKLDNIVPAGQYVPDMSKYRLQKCLQYLEEGHDKLVLIGSDCEVFSPCIELETALSSYDVVLTPHVLEPLPSDGHTPDMAQIYRTGHANSDVIGFRNTTHTKNILRWLISVVENEDREKGIFYDQTWLSALPFVYDNIHILRHPGYNVAYWNIVERNVKKVGNVWMAGKETLRIMHYSGFVPGQPQIMSKYQNRHVATGNVLELYKSYSDRIGL